jgi:hypothetical protein
MRQHDCFENGSVKVGDGHELILRPKTQRELVLGAPCRAQGHANDNHNLRMGAVACYQLRDESRRSGDRA